MKLTGKKVIVTGASRSIGREIAISFAKQGAEVVISYNQNKTGALETVKMIESYGVNALAIQADFAKPEVVQSFFNAAIDFLGRVDILINNAAIDSKVKKMGLRNSNSFEKFSLNDWEKQISVGLTGSMLCSQIFGSAMSKRNRGVILNIASDLSVIAPDQRLYSHIDNSGEKFFKPFAYGASKSGLANLTKYLATYWAKNNVRVNTMTLGGVYNNQDKEFVKKYIHKVPMWRMANTNDFSGALIFLLSDSSSYVTGADIVIDGGFSAW